MFNRKKEVMARNGELDNARNILSKGTSISGDIETNGDIRIDGSLNGTINSGGKVVVGNSGLVEGEVNCQNATVSGTIKGKLTVKGLLEMMATSQVEGEIIYGKLSVEPEAKISGTLSLGAVIKDISSDSNKIDKPREKKQA